MPNDDGHHHFIQQHGDIPTERQIAVAESIVIIPIGHHERKSVEEVTDSDLMHWMGAKRVKSLSLSSPVITQRGIDVIGAMKSLEYLSLHGCSVDDRALATIAELPELRYLDLSGTRVTVAGLRQLRSCEKLLTLNLASTKIGDDVTEIAQLLRVKELDLSYTEVTDRCVKELEKCPRLEILDVSGTEVSIASFDSLKRMSQLKELVLPLLDRDAVAGLRARLPKAKIHSY